MFVPSGVLWPHSETTRQALSHGLLSCTSAQGAYLVGQRQVSNTCVPKPHQLSVARRSPHLEASERYRDSTGLTVRSRGSAADTADTWEARWVLREGLPIVS